MRQRIWSTSARHEARLLRSRGAMPARTHRIQRLRRIVGDCRVLRLDSCGRTNTRAATGTIAGTRHA